MGFAFTGIWLNKVPLGHSWLLPLYLALLQTGSDSWGDQTCGQANKIPGVELRITAPPPPEMKVKKQKGGALPLLRVPGFLSLSCLRLKIYPRCREIDPENIHRQKFIASSFLMI